MNTFEYFSAICGLENLIIYNLIKNLIDGSEAPMPL